LIINYFIVMLTPISVPRRVLQPYYHCQRTQTMALKRFHRDICAKFRSAAFLNADGYRKL